MGPVCEDGYDTVRAGRESLDHKLRLPAAQMEDARDSCGNRLTGWRERPVNEQVVVCGARSFLAGGHNLHPVGGKYYPNARAVDDRPIYRLDDVHPSRATAAGTRQRGEGRAREENSAQNARNRAPSHFLENPTAHHDQRLRPCRAVLVEGGPKIRRDRLRRPTLDVRPLEHVREPAVLEEPHLR